MATRLGGGDPNSAVSFEYIPGSMIRGMVIARYRQKYLARCGRSDFSPPLFRGKCAVPECIPANSKRACIANTLVLASRKEQGEANLRLRDRCSEWQSAMEKMDQPFCYLWEVMRTDAKLNCAARTVKLASIHHVRIAKELPKAKAQSFATKPFRQNKLSAVPFWQSRKMT